MAGEISFWPPSYCAPSSILPPLGHLPYSPGVLGMATKKHNHPIALMTFGKITRVPPKIKMEFQIQQGASAQWAPFL